MKLTKIAYVLLMACSFAACKKELDIDPEQSLPDVDVYTTRQGAQAAVLGIYSSAQVLDAFGGLPLVIGDYMADNVEFVGSFPTLQELNQFTTLANNTSIAPIWQNHYRIITRANAVILRVPSITEAGFTDAQKNQLVAEAKFMRALTYFQLVNLFAQPFNCSNGSNLGVPLVLTEFDPDKPVDFPARSTVAQVHAQIKKDLEEAIPDLPSAPSVQNDRGRASKAAARGLLSRFHLYRGEWALAASYADEVIKSTGYTLATNYSFYDVLSPEDIFTIIMTTTDNSRTGSGGLASYHRPASSGGRGDAPFSTSLVNAYLQEAGDRRLTISDSATAADGIRRRFSLKYFDATTNADNTPIIRVTEMYLNRAEALAELNGINQASIDLINALRTRAGLTPWTLTTFTTKQAFIDAILNERRKELAFEGHRRMDLLRRGLPLRTTGTNAAQTAPCTGNKVILPIPQREIDINPSLRGQQNPGF